MNAAWQPRETAPRDGSWFLTWSEPPGEYWIGMDFAKFDLELEQFVKCGCGWAYVQFWMPLPPPPRLPA